MKLTISPVGLGTSSAPNAGSGCSEINKTPAHLLKKVDEAEKKKELPVPAPAKRSEPPMVVPRRAKVSDFVSSHLK